MDNTGNIPPSAMNWDISRVYDSTYGDPNIGPTNWPLNPNPPNYTLPPAPMLPGGAIWPAPSFHQGCICPPTSEQTCRGDHCPRQSSNLNYTANVMADGNVAQ